MELYIEYVIIDNLVVNMLILLCTKATLKIKTKFYRVFLSSLVGTVFAVLTPLLNIPSVLLLFMKIGLGALMILIFSSFKTVKSFLFCYVSFFAFTLLLGGACIATLLLFGTSIEKLASGGYDIIVPLGVILLIVSLYVCIIIEIARFVTSKRSIEPFIREVELVVAKKHLRFNAFIDSGNKLIDKKTGLPVIILSVKILEKYFSKTELEDLLLNFGKSKKSPFNGVHVISYGTISGEAKKMVVFEADSICIKSQTKEYITNNFMVGVTYQSFQDAVKYDMLLNPAMLQGV